MSNPPLTHHVLCTSVSPFASMHNNLTSTAPPTPHCCCCLETTFSLWYFTVEDTTDFTICAKVSSHIENRAVTVVCQGMVGFMFRNISHVALEGLTFTSCGKGEVTYSPVYSDYMTTYGVSIYLGQDIKISNCSIQDTAGTAMGVLYSSLNLRGSNSFTNNCRGCFDRNHTSLYASGGGIYT